MALKDGTYFLHYKMYVNYKRGTVQPVQSDIRKKIMVPKYFC